MPVISHPNLDGKPHHPLAVPPVLKSMIAITKVAIIVNKKIFMFLLDDRLYAIAYKFV